MTTALTATVVVEPTAIIAETLNNAAHNAYTDSSETLAQALVETYVEDGYKRPLVERIIGSVDPEWLTAQVIKPQIHTRLASERLRGRRPHIDKLAARSFGSTEELFASISDGEWRQVVDRAGADVHWILCQVIVLAVEAFFLTAEEAAGKNAKPNVVEQQALAMLGAKIGSARRGRALAIRQASQRAGYLPLPADDATAGIFAPAVRPAQDFAVDLPEADHANVVVRGNWTMPAAQPKFTYLVGMPHRGGKEFERLTTPEIEALMRDITSQAHRKLLDSFSSVYVFDFYAVILTALISKVDAASVDVGTDDTPTTELQARPQDGPHLITWQEIDGIRGFSRMNFSEEHLAKIREDFTEFVNLLSTIRASSGTGRSEFSGHLVIADGVKTIRGASIPGGKNRRGQFEYANFTLGIAMSTWLYGRRKRGLAPRFSSLYLPHLSTGIPTSRQPTYLRRQMLVAAIATKTNDENMRAADAQAAHGAGASGISNGTVPWWRDSTRPTVGFTLGELAGIGIRIQQPERNSTYAAIIASKDRAAHAKLLRELLDDLLEKQVIAAAWIHGDDPESASAGAIHRQPATAKVVVVLPHQAILEHQARLANDLCVDG